MLNMLSQDVRTLIFAPKSQMDVVKPPTLTVKMTRQFQMFVPKMLWLDVRTPTLLLKTVKLSMKMLRLDLKTALMVKTLSQDVKLDLKVVTPDPCVKKELVLNLLHKVQNAQQESGLRMEKSMKLLRGLTKKVLSTKSTDGLTSMD